MRNGTSAIANKGGGGNPCPQWSEEQALEGARM